MFNEWWYIIRCLMKGDNMKDVELQQMKDYDWALRVKGKFVGKILNSKVKQTMEDVIEQFVIKPTPVSDKELNELLGEGWLEPDDVLKIKRMRDKE